MIEFLIVADPDQRITPVFSDPTDNVIVICLSKTEPVSYMQKIPLIFIDTSQKQPELRQKHNFSFQ